MGRVPTIPGSDEPFCYVTTTGRRSGRPHTVEIWFAVAGRTLYVLAGGRDRADFVRNLRAHPEARVRIAGQEHLAVVRFPEPGSEEDERARRLVLHKYDPSGDQGLASWTRVALPVAFDLDLDLDPQNG